MYIEVEVSSCGGRINIVPSGHGTCLISIFAENNKYLARHVDFQHENVKHYTTFLEKTPEPFQCLDMTQRYY
jgi:tRNA(Phe) wybutosine-synthesizing methylase Tyw3